MGKVWFKPFKKATAFLLALAMVASPVSDYSALSTVKAAGASITVNESAGYEEGAYVEWAPVDGADGYVAYVSKDNSTWTQLDDELIRQYDNYFRVDALGLTAGTWYVKVVAGKFDSSKQLTENLAETVQTVTVTNYDRSGYAFSSQSPLKTASGAYNDDGSLKDGAQVIYVTKNTAKTVTAKIHSNGVKKDAVTVTGIQAILDAKQKSGTSDDILDIRIIGCVNKDDLDGISSSAEGLQVKGNSEYTNMNLTIEGVGEDAAIKGFGMLIRNCGNVELRNFGVLNFMDDGISIDTDNCNLWVHNLDIFYGQAGGDSDQKKGDGSLDIKLSQYCTVSYNHFWDSGKCSLIDAGAKGASERADYLTYHHNWFDHSDSRHPRIRNGLNFHIYNNYYDGNSKYGVGITTGASAFVESNYFRNCQYPMMSSLQGSDVFAGGTVKNVEKNKTFSGEAGGIIKAYGNVMTGNCTFIPYGSDTYLLKGVEGTAYDLSGTTSTVDFDAYVVTDKSETVPDTVTTASGGTTYSNFDTASTMYSYTADAAEDVPSIVTAKAGRLNGGDLQFDFSTVENADTSYDISPELKNLVVNYTSSLVAVGGVQSTSVKADATETPDVSDGGDGNNGNDNSGTGSETGDGSTKIGTEVVEHDITQLGTSSSKYIKVTGSLNSKSKNTTSAEYNGKTYTGTPVKMESGTNFEFETTTTADVVLVLASASTARFNYDYNNSGTLTKVTAVNGVLTISSLAAGKYKISKGDTVDVYAIIVIPSGTTTVTPEVDTKYTITVDKNDGVTAVSSFEVTAGEQITTAKLPTPTRDGYTFTGWVDGSNNAINLPYTPAGSMTIKATWQQDATDDVVVDTEALYNMSLEIGEIPSKTFTSTFTKNGFTIHAGDGKDASDKANQDVSAEGNSKEINGVTYTSRLKLGNAGTADYRSVSFTTKAAATLYVACMSGKSGETRSFAVATLSDGKFVNYTGAYTLDGASDTTSDGKITVDGSKGHYATIELPSAGTYYIYSVESGVNFYAIKVTYANGKSAPTCKVSFNTNGGDEVVSQTVWSGETCIEPVSTKDGYEFVGWYTDYDCTQAYDFSTPVTSASLTLFAKWKESNEPENTSLILDMKELTVKSYTSSFKKNGFNFTASSDAPLSVDANAQTVAGADYTQRLKLGGAGDKTKRNISFTITEDSVLTIVAASSSSGSERKLEIDGGSTSYELTGIDAAAKYTQELGKGTWYVYSPSSGVNIYYIAVTAKNSGTDDGNKGNDGNKGDDGNKVDDTNSEGLQVKLAQEGETYTYTGSAITPDIIVTNNGQKLTAGVDYTVKYTNNINASTGEGLNVAAAKKPKITVTGKGNLSGSAYTYFEIQQADIAKAESSAIVTTVNTKPAAPALLYEGQTLTAKDYTLKYVDAKKETDVANGKYAEAADVAGYAVVTGQTNFKGTLEIPVKVVSSKNELKKIAVQVGTEKLTYNGAEQEPAITVYDSSDKSKTALAADAYTIVYSTSKKNAGTVKFTVIGQNGYTGSVTKTYKISPLKADSSSVSTNLDKTVAENGKSYVSTGVTVSDELTVTYKETVLTEGVDYKITYTNNKKVGTAKYKVNFLGNYKGTAAISGEFVVNPVALDNRTVESETDGLEITVPDKIYTKSGIYKSAPYVSINGVALKSSDYTVTYYLDETLQTEMKGANKVTLGAGETSKTVWVKIVGKGNYRVDNAELYATASYKVYSNSGEGVIDLSKAVITFADGKTTTKAEYTGKKVEPAVVVKDGKGSDAKEIPAASYEVVYVNNVNKGKATVVIKPAENSKCVGSKTATFSIVAQKLSSTLLDNLLGKNTQ